METQLMFETDKLGSLLLQRRQIEDYGGTTSPSFNQWVKEVRKEVRKVVKANNGVLLSFSGKCHYFWSCFIQAANGQIWYISCSDVRHFPDNDIMYRTAESDKDYTGGSNCNTAPGKLTKAIEKMLN